MIASTNLDGATRRDEALYVLTETREIYIVRGRRALLTRLLDRRTATADDVRAAVDLPADLDPVCRTAGVGAGRHH